MSHFIAPDYGQQFLFPPALEDWVARDHPVRFLREFVDQLDLGTLGFVIPQASEGRPTFAPGLLLKIWLHGYYHRIRSTRKLEAACRDHLALMWLCGLIVPDHNSLWRFWRDNQKALRKIFKQSVQVAVRTGCVGMAVQALDGTKIQACASGYSGWSKKHMEELLAALDGALAQTELKVVQENSDLNAETVSLPKGLEERRVLREEIKKGLAQLQEDERKHYHPVEPEARRMEVSGTNRFAYNAQVVADEKEGIIVACEVTRQETDSGQLVVMIEQAQENLGPATVGAPPLTLADTGYGVGADLQEAVEKQLPVLAYPLEGKSARGNPYAGQHFTYDESAHTVVCPRGMSLDHEGGTTKRGVKVERFRCHCHDCPVRSSCTRDPKGRQIEVWPHTTTVQAMRQKLRDPEVRAILQRRPQIIESRFAQLKQNDQFRRWTVWGLEGVRTQWSLLCATLNLRILYKRWRAAQKGEPEPKMMAAVVAAAKNINATLVKPLKSASLTLISALRLYSAPQILRGA